jgi:YHS domain-containing protein
MGSKATAATKVVDPVCSMEVTDTKTAPTAVYKGKTYYFCSEEDKAKFEKNPEQYLKS